MWCAGEFLNFLYYCDFDLVYVTYFPTIVLRPNPSGGNFFCAEKLSFLLGKAFCVNIANFCEKLDFLIYQINVMCLVYKP